MAVGKSIPEHVLAELRDGSHDAFQQVYLHYIDSVWEFLRMLIKSDADSEEIAQDVFVALWEKRGRIDPSKNIKPYLYANARNAVLNYFKHKKVKDKYMQFAVNSIPRYETSDEIVIAQETELLIMITVERMPAQRRRVFKMSRFEGLSNDEIAVLLKLSKNTVENHITTAVKDIRRTLGIALMLLF